MKTILIYMKEEHKKEVHPCLFMNYQTGLYSVYSDVDSVEEGKYDYVLTGTGYTLYFNIDKFYIHEVCTSVFDDTVAALQTEIEHVNESIEIVAELIKHAAHDHVYDDGFENKMSEHLLELTRLKHEKHTLEDVIERHLRSNSKEV